MVGIAFEALLLDFRCQTTEGALSLMPK